MKLFSTIAFVLTLFGAVAGSHAQTAGLAAAPSAPTSAPKSSVPVRVGQTLFAQQRCPKGQGVTFVVTSIDEAQGTADGTILLECWGKTGFAFNNKFWGKLKFSGDTVVFTMIDSANMQQRLTGGITGKVVRDGSFALDFGVATFDTTTLRPTSLSLVFRDQGAQQARQ